MIIKKILNRVGITTADGSETGYRTDTVLDVLSYKTLGVYLQVHESTTTVTVGVEGITAPEADGDWVDMSSNLLADQSNATGMYVGSAVDVSALANVLAVPTIAAGGQAKAVVSLWVVLKPL